MRLLKDKKRKRGAVRFSAIAAGLAVVVLSSMVVSSPAVAQEQTGWYVNDAPALWGPGEYWWAGDADEGYGANDYVYTYAIGGEDSVDNWAQWSMGRRVGRQELEVYVPHTRATATVTYQIVIGGSTYRWALAQADLRGWTSLGHYDAHGAEVTVVLRDTDATQHWRRDGYAASSIGVDAIRARCVSACSGASSNPPGRASVWASGGAGSLSVSWSASAGSSPIQRWELEQDHPGGHYHETFSAGRASVFWVGEPAGRHVIWVRACNEHGCGAWGTATTTVQSNPEPPGRASVWASGGAGSLSVSWSASAGSSPIQRWELEQDHPGGHYHETFSAGRASVFWVGEPAGRHVIWVRACNEHGCGAWGTATTTVQSNPEPPVGQVTNTQELRAWGDQFVGWQEAAHPWLRVAWNHIRDRTHYQSRLNVWGNASYYCQISSLLWICQTTSVNISNISNYVLVHELAHVYDYTTGLAPRQAWGAVQLYFDTTYADCRAGQVSPDEILADTIAYIENSSYRLYYYNVASDNSGVCPSLPRRPSSEALEVVRAGLAGRVPDWYHENITNGTDLWAAMRASGSTRIMANLAGEFGGLCSTDWLAAWPDPARTPADGTNPFRDGGCEQ